MVSEVAHPSFRSEQLACWPASLWSSHLKHDGLERQARWSAKLANERFAQSVNNVIRIDSAAGANHVDQWVPVDQRTRKGADIRDLLFLRQHSNPQIDESGVAHRRLNRVDFVVPVHDDATLDERSFWMGSVPLRNQWFADSQLEEPVSSELVSEGPEIPC